MKYPSGVPNAVPVARLFEQLEAMRFDATKLVELRTWIDAILDRPREGSVLEIYPLSLAAPHKVDVWGVRLTSGVAYLLHPGDWLVWSTIHGFKEYSAVAFDRQFLLPGRRVGVDPQQGTTSNDAND